MKGRVFICLWFLLVLLSVRVLPVQSLSFPGSPDPALDAQQRWGAVHQGYVTTGCLHGTSATTTATLGVCRAFVLETLEPPGLKGFSDPSTAITYSAGAGIYWLGGRATPSLVPPGWTCLAGRHYCWIKQDARPTTASILPLLQVTLSATAITAVAEAAPRYRTVPETLAASRTTTAGAPWTWSGAGAIVTVAAGQTLTLGSCPEAGRYQIFDANETTTGRVRFAPGACGLIYPEWWGADPTGVVDSTAVWRTVLAVIAGPANPGEKAAIACAGTYALSSSGAEAALILPIGARILGVMARPTGTSASFSMPCTLAYSGTGIVLTITSEPAVVAGNIQLENLTLVDLLGTAAFGLHFTYPGSTILRNVTIGGFDTGMYTIGNWYYGYAEAVTLLNARVRCADVNGPAINGMRLELRCQSNATTIVEGMRLGTTSAVHDLLLKAVIEVRSGIPLVLHRVQAVTAQLYIEMGGTCADYSQGLRLGSVQGGTIVLRLFGDCTGTPDIPIGINVVNTEGGGYQNTHNLTLSGHLAGKFTQPVFVEGVAGMWGLDLSRLSIDRDTPPAALGNYSTGVQLGHNYLTHSFSSSIPVDRGRGSTLSATTWPLGDVVWVTQDGGLANRWQFVTVPGNPPAVQTVLLNGGSITVAEGIATPSVREGTVQLGQVILSAGTTAVTNFLDGINTQQLLVAVTSGTRTLVHTAGTLNLATNANFAMTAGDNVTLTRISNQWWETARVDKP